MNRCRGCSVELNSENRTPSAARRNVRTCTTCAREACRLHRLANLEKMRAKDRERAKLNSARKVAAAKAWVLANPERTRENKRRSEERRRAQRPRIWRPAAPHNHSPKRMATHRWHGAARRARRYGVQISEKDTGHYLTALAAERATGLRYVVDHIRPFSKGGSHDPANMVVMADWLNALKGEAEWPWLEWFNRP